MKNSVWALIFFACFMVSSAHARNCACESPETFIVKYAEKVIDDRVYLKSGCVFVASKDIFLKIEEEMMPLEAVYCDENGIYVYAYQLSLEQCGTCKRYYNPEEQRVMCPHRFKWEK